MPENLDAERANLERELAGITAEWARINTEFTGPAPEMPCSPTEWLEASDNGLLLRRSDPNGGNLPTFAAAYQQTCIAVQQMLLGRFASWASQVVATFGGDSFQRLEVPDPPIHHLPLPGRDTETVTAWVTGTPNTSAAGCRIIFWAAAYKDPKGLQRSPEINRLVFMWANQVVDFHAFDHGPRSQGDHQGEFFGQCFPPPALMNWVAEGLATLHRASAKAEDHAPRIAYILRRLEGSMITVQFGEETGTIKGVQSVRLSALIRQERIDVLELASDLKAARSSRSVIAASDIADSEVDESSTTGPGIDYPAIRDELRPLNAHRKKLEHEILEATSELERTELESEMQQIQQEVARICRRPPSQITKARERVERGLRLMAENKEESMPNFANHIRESIAYDTIKTQFTYLPAIRPEWEFCGFD